MRFLTLADGAPIPQLDPYSTVALIAHWRETPAARARRKSVPSVGAT
jgi:hypothetical protein